MPGMNSGPNPASPILVSAFQSALLHQLLLIMVLAVLLLVAWGVVRTTVFGNGNVTGTIAAGSAADGMAPAPTPGLISPARGLTTAWNEPQARRLLRVGFGLIWLFDGILQAQPQMAGGLADQVIQPTASSSPTWVQDLVNWGVNVWDYHPIEAAAASVWIQVGIGLWMIVAVRGWSARLAGLAGVAWGLVVWAFGEAFGGIFAPGLTVLFGAPGAVLLYVVAGALLALPERAWDTARLGRLLLAGLGAFFLGMALLQAWPGRGFWQGTIAGQPGSLAAMVKSMVGTSQPHPFAALVSWFANLTTAHGFAVNLIVVLALALIGVGCCVAAWRDDRRLALVAVVVAVVFCLADWLLVEDLGFFGGLGTDPNSMIPFALLFGAGYAGLRSDAGGDAAGDVAGEAPPVPPVWRVPAVLRGFAAAPLWAVAGFGAVAVILVGAAPMAWATVNRTADPIVAEALAGSSGQLDTPAPDFTLTSQDGRQVALSSLRGKVVLLTFLDPVCTTDCPLIAQEMRSADTLLGGKAGNTELVAVVANPTYTSVAYTKAFTNQENLDSVPNWLYLTGSLAQLDAVWHHYGIEVENLPAGAMTAHNDLAFVIDANGKVKQELSDDPGPGTGATLSSFAGLMASSVLQTMGQG